jgi:hypothetical protein
MDRAFGKQGLADMVKNCVEAMGKMGREEFDSALQRAVEHSSDAPCARPRFRRSRRRARSARCRKWSRGSRSWTAGRARRSCEPFGSGSAPARCRC